MVFFLASYSDNEENAVLDALVAIEALVVIRGINRWTWALFPRAPCTDVNIQHWRHVTNFAVTPLLVWAALKNVLVRCPGELRSHIDRYLRLNLAHSRLVTQLAGALLDGLYWATRSCGPGVLVADRPPDARMFPKFGVMKRCAGCLTSGFSRYFTVVNPMPELRVPSELVDFAFFDSFGWEMSLRVTYTRPDEEGEYETVNVVDIDHATQYAVTDLGGAFLMSLGGVGLKKFHGCPGGVDDVVQKATSHYFATLGYGASVARVLADDDADGWRRNVRYFMKGEPGGRSLLATCGTCRTQGVPYYRDMDVKVTLGAVN